MVWILGGAAIVLVVIVGLIAALLISRGGNGDGPGVVAAEVTSTSASSTTTTAAPTTTTTLDPVAQSRQQHPKLYEVVLRLENIITQSTQGRSGVGEAVDGVRGCSMDPYDAEQAINDVVFNRSTVLSQVAGVDVTGDPEAGMLVDKLQEAIQHSIDADRHYNNWISYLYTDYYYTTPVGCPSGEAPLNSDYDEGTADSGRATTAKQDFVAAYNPIAASLGMRTWEYTDI